MKNRDFRHPQLAVFADRAASFCSAVDGNLEFSAEQRIAAVHVALADVYAGALALPRTGVLFDPNDDATEDDPDEPEPPDPDRVLPESARAALNSMLDPVGLRTFYRAIFDPYASDEKEVMGSLHDDLADIYLDLISGLEKWRRGENGEALFEWRFNFEYHWARHATSALGALSALCAWYELEWPCAAA